MSNSTEYQLRNWDDDRTAEIITINTVCLVILAISVALRIYAQGLLTSPWKAWDTWFTILASIFAIALSAIQMHTLTYGLGKHTLRVIVEDATPPGNLAKIFMFGYIQTILQAACIMCTKLAILALYARVFGMMHHDRFFTYGVYACTVYSILLGVGSIIEFIVQCIPPPVFWNRIYLLFPGGHTDGPTEGYCMDQVTHIVVPVVLDLTSEIAIMILPIKILWNLQLPWRKKAGLMLTFGLGFFVCATNIVRIVAYAKMVNGGDIAWDDIDAFIWTIVQMCFAIVCASIPPCAPLLTRGFGRNPGATQGYGSGIRLSDRSKTVSSRWTRSHDKFSSRQGLGQPHLGVLDSDGESLRDLNRHNHDMDLETHSGF